jgi:hypothetical protein
MPPWQHSPKKTPPKGCLGRRNVFNPKVYCSALSVMAWLHAMPSGAFVIAGLSGDTAASKVATV